jgi:Rod binding domain-containing protein
LANNQGLAGQGSARQGLAAGGTGAGASGRRLAPGRTVRTAEPPAAADGEASATGSAEAPDAAAAAGTAAGTSTVAQTANQTADQTGSETGTKTGSQTGPQDQPAVGPGAFGRRYRPLDNGRIVEARLKTSEMTEEQRLGQLAQIRKSAEEYEGMLIAEMIKSMRQSPFVKTPGGDTYAEIAEKPFTAALTAAGGLGLAQTIITQVASQEGLGDTLDAHPEVMGPRYRARLSPSQMRKPGPRAVRPDGGGQAPAPAVAQAASEAASPADAESPAEL